MTPAHTQQLTHNTKAEPDKRWQKPADTSPLPHTIPTVPGETINSYTSRLATTLGVRQITILNRLGIKHNGTNYLSHNTSQQTETMAKILRLPLEDFTPLLWPTGPYKGKQANTGNPRTTRLCPHCLAETGAWQMSWVDPLIYTCTTHHTLLLDNDPNTHRRFRTYRTPTYPPNQLAQLRSSVGQPIPRLTDTQTQLTQLRRQWINEKPLQYGTGKYLPETLALEAQTMTRHTHNHNPASPALKHWLGTTIDQLTEAGRAPVPEPTDVSTINRLHGPVELTAALAPQLIVFLNEGIQGTRETLDNMLDHMFQEHRQHTWAARNTLYQWATAGFA